MLGLDEWLTNQGGGWVFVLLIGALLGLRHATDPDHLSALLTLRLNKRQRAPHYIGFSWGIGHAISLVLVGIPLIYFFGALPDALQRTLEFAVGVLISVLALRVMLRLAFLKKDNHTHRHHNGPEHAHPHTHSSPGHAHRTSKMAFAIGVLHGTGGSAGAVALVLSRMQSHLMASVALVVLAVFTAISMAFCSWLLCRGMDATEQKINMNRPALIGSVGAFIFGLWYAASAFEIVSYPF
jgi:cation transport ATPase